jgi:diguanylate cyclase (GGDEF)-like protein
MVAKAMSRRLSITQLSLGFILVVISLMAILAVQMFLEVRSIHAEIEREQMENGRMEVAEAIASVDQDIKARASRLAHWDEAQQQLANAEYYALWRDTRIQSSGLFPPMIESVGLYDKTGKILAPDLSRHNPLPVHLPFNSPGYVSYNSVDHNDLHYFFPIYADPDQHILMGYGGFSFDFLLGIKRIRQFSYADPDSFSPSFPDHGIVSLDTLVNQFRFQPQPLTNLDQFLTTFRETLIQFALFSLAILLLAAFLIHKFMVRPLRRISSDLKESDEPEPFHPGNTRKSEWIRIEELENVRHSIHDYQTRVQKLKIALEESNKQLFEQAHHDALSGAFNRRAFDNDGQSLSNDLSYGRYALLLFDCDRFKEINDNYGHAVGDAVISTVSHCLQQALRAEDRLYRLGGDEFAALLMNISRDQTEAIVERCLKQIAKFDFSLLGLSASVVLSTGVVLADPDMSFNEALRHADNAMYQAKQASGIKVVIYESPSK